MIPTLMFVSCYKGLHFAEVQYFMPLRKVQYASGSVPKRACCSLLCCMSLLDTPAVTHVEEGGHRTDVPEVLITETVFPAFLSALSKIYMDS